MTDEQAKALRVLMHAFRVATDTGLLDHLLCFTDSPDSINDVVESCECAMQNYA